MSHDRLGALRLVHHHPGRLRLRARAFREDPSAFEEVRAALSQLRPVTRVKCNAETGSLLLEYEPGQIEPDDLVKLVAKSAGLSRIVDELMEKRDPAELPRKIMEGGKELNRLFAGMTNGLADLGSLVPAGLLAAGFYSLVRRPALPRWESLLFWSYSMFMSLNEDRVRAPPRGGG